MKVLPKQPSAKGPAATFTGDVYIDAIARGEEPSRIRVNAVRFTPGARTAWHSHARGQTLYVTDGKGLVQARAGTLPKSGPATSSIPPRANGTGTVPTPTTSCHTFP